MASTTDNSPERDADCGASVSVWAAGPDGPEIAAPDSIGFAVLGGGPAGLTGAYALGLRGKRVAVFEADRQVGGIAKTVEIDGYRFDLGGHRFFTKLKQLEALWA